jgi:hypothetical protein
LTRIGEKFFIPFGVVDALGGIWTLLANQKERKGNNMHRLIEIIII